MGASDGYAVTLLTFASCSWCERPRGTQSLVLQLYLPGARRPLPSGMGMNDPLPEGNQYAILLASTLPTSSCFRRFKVSRSLEEKHERSLDLVSAHQAGTAHATSAVLSATHLAAVGRHSIGANPSKPPASAVGSRHASCDNASLRLVPPELARLWRPGRSARKAGAHPFSVIWGPRQGKFSLVGPRTLQASIQHAPWPLPA